MNQEVATLTAETLSLIEEHLHHLLAIMGFASAKVTAVSKKEKDRAGLPSLTLKITIEAGSDGRLLIGAQGQHLSALRHLVHSLLRRQLPSPLRLNLDVNGYLAARERALSYLAEEAARKAGLTRQAVVLPPMAAAQRHIIHSSLSSRHDVNTESLGAEPNRRVVVRPIF